MPLDPERFFARLKQYAEAAAPAVALLLVLLVFLLGIRTERTGFVQEVLDPGIKRITQPVLNAFRGKPPEVDHYRLDLSEDALDGLLLIRDSALIAGYLDPVYLPSVLVQVRTEQDSVEALLSLITRTVEHLREDRWHFRLRSRTPVGPLSAHDQLLLDPVSIGYIPGWLMDRAARSIGLPSLGSALADLTLNDKDLGLYAWAPALDSTILLALGLADQPWGAFDRGLYDQAQLGNMRTPFLMTPLPQERFSVAPVTPVISTGGTSLEDERAWAKAMLTLQRDPQRATDLLDVERTAKLLALSDVFGVQSALNWRELFFVLDGTGDRLIPFFHAPKAGGPITTLSFLSPEVVNDPLIGALFRMPELRAAYFEQLEHWCVGDRLDRFLAEKVDTIHAMDKLIQVEHPEASYDPKVIQHDRLVVRRILRPRNPAMGNIQESGSGNMARIASLHLLPLEVKAIVYGSDTVPLVASITLPPRADNSPLDYVGIPLESGWILDHVAIILQVPGTREPLMAPLIRASSLNAEPRK